MKRVVVRIFLPIDMGMASKLLAAVAEAFPGAELATAEDIDTVDLVADVPEPAAPAEAA